MTGMLPGTDVPRTIGAMGRPVAVIDAGEAAARVDALFRADETLVCVAVHSPDGTPTWGLVTRTRFGHQMTGPLGYGRLLHATKPVAALTDWSPLVVTADRDVTDVAREVLDRDQEPGHPVDHVLVTDPRGADRGVTRVDVADLFRVLSAQLAAKALTDPLTGLANRDHFLQHLQRLCHHRSPGRPLAVLYIDLDSFKAVNDGHGHGVGDAVLQVVADRLQSCCGPGDLAARLGGDEFALIAHLPHDDARDLTTLDQTFLDLAAADLGRRVQAGLRGAICVDGLELPARASIGLAVAARTGADLDALLREADLAMYRAKSVGGDRVEVVTDVGTRPAPETFVPDRRELQNAVDDGQFEVFYQPIVGLTDRRLASVEALVRWNHPRRGLLAPAAFLDAVDAAGFAAVLDAHVLTLALTRFDRWRRELGAHAPTCINVNVSVQALLHPDLTRTLLGALAAAALPPQVLRLELPEGATSLQLDTVKEPLSRLRSAGVRLTLDDLGAGASTLHHLTALALDGVKIDRRFIAGMVQEERDAAVVRMLVDLAVGTGLAVTAEGVETPEQLHLLTTLAQGRTVFVQGHLLGRPVPADALPLPWPGGLHGARGPGPGTAAAPGPSDGPPPAR